MKIRPILLSLSAIALLAGLLLVANATQQSKERLITRMPAEQNDPLSITGMKVKGRSISFDQKFVADDDWMKSLVVTVKNKSEKRVLFASIELFFPRPKGSKDQGAMFDVFYGNRALQDRQPTASEQLIGIAPGETTEIGFSVQKFVDLTSFLKATNFPQSIEKLNLRLGSVIFDDNTMWRGGFFVEIQAIPAVGIM